jgi:hypothetical protein
MTKAKRRAAALKGWRKRGRKRARYGRPATQKSALRARRTIKQIKRRRATPLARATARKYRMRSNPNGIMGVVKAAMPIAVSLYGARIVSGKLAGRIPGFNNIPAQFQGPAMAGIILLGSHFLTKKVKFFKKHRAGIMIGVSINLFDRVLMAFAPEDVKGMIGLGADGIYDEALGDYVTVGDYLTVGDAPPIDDDITLSDYVTVGQYEEELGVEEELGAIEEELGVEEELGAADPLSRKYLGGVARGSMLKKVGHQRLIADVPARSFTKKVPPAAAGFDKPGVLYTGIFSGGFGY